LDSLTKLINFEIATAQATGTLAGMHKLGQTKKYKLSEKEFVSVI
jgi:hypothetical protein